MNKNKWWLVGVIIVILAVVGFSNLQKSDDSELGAIKIGYIGPLSGNAAVLGEDAVKSMRLAVDEVNANGGINGRMVELLIEDDQYDTKQSVTAYNKLVNVDGVDVLIMSTYGGVFAVADQSEKDSVLIIDPLDCDAEFSQTPKTVFCIAKETEDLGYVIADYAASSGKKAPAVLHATVDQFMPSVGEAFEKRFEETNAGDVVVESYIPNTTDFRSHLLKLKGADAIVWLGYDEIGLAMKQARELGIDAEFLTIPSVASSPEVQRAAQGAAEGMRFSFYTPSATNKQNRIFREKFEAKYAMAPVLPIVSDQTYDSIQILLTEVFPAVTKPSKSGQLNEMIERLLAVKNYKGVTGTLEMTPGKRISGIKLSLFELKNNTPVQVVSD